MAPKRRASAKLKNIHVDYSLRRNSQELTDLNATDMDDPDERDIEAEVQKSAARGLNADVIFVYALDEDVAKEEEEKEAKKSLFERCFGGKDDAVKGEATKGRERSDTLTKIEERKAARGETLDKLKYVGLRVVKQKSRDGKRMFVKLTAPQSRLEQEAERLEIDMKLSSSGRKEGKNETVAYEAFTRANRRMFARKPATCISASGGLSEAQVMVRGMRLFSALERQRLIFSIIEAAADPSLPPEMQGAELDPDALVSQRVFTTFFPLHSTERDELYTEWADIKGLRVWPCTGRGGTKRRLFPDIGLLQQPLDDVRDYFGEKVQRPPRAAAAAAAPCPLPSSSRSLPSPAPHPRQVGFYFAWLEHYTTALMWLMWMAVITRIVADAGNNSTSAAGKTAAAVITPLYAVIVAVWTTLQSEVWKRQTAVLAYKWDVQDFEEEEQPRPEFLRSYYDGFWSTSEKKRQENQVNTQHGTGEDTKGAMKKRRGFYDARKRFVHDPDGDLTLMMEPWKRAKIYVTGSPMLALMAVIMMVVTFAILTFRMIMQVGSPATPISDPTFPPHIPPT